MGVIPILLLLSFSATDFEKNITKANELRAQRKFAEAESEYKRLLEGAEGRNRAKLLNNLAATYHQTGRFADAKPMYAGAIAAFAQLGDIPNQAIALSNLGELHRTLGDSDAAAETYSSALKLRQTHFGSGHSSVAASLNSLACLKIDRGAYGEAERLLLESRAIREKNGDIGDNHYAAVTHNLAEVRRLRGQPDEAEPLFQQALELKLKLFGDLHPEVANTLNSLGALHHDRGDLEKAEAYAERTLSIRRKVNGPRHPYVAISLNNLALMASDGGDLEKGRKLLREAIGIMEEAAGQEHFLGAFLINLGDSYRRSRNWGEADEAYRRAVQTLEKIPGGEVWLAEALTGLASVFAAQEKLAGAEKLLKQAIQIRARTTGNDTPAYANAQRDLAMLYRAQKRTTEAVRLEKSFR